MKNIGILGSTGSVGTQSLQVVENHPEKFNIKFLAAHSNIDLLSDQAKFFDLQKQHSPLVSNQEGFYCSGVKRHNPANGIHRFPDKEHEDQS